MTEQVAADACVRGANLTRDLKMARRFNVCPASASVLPLLVFAELSSLCSATPGSAAHTAVYSSAQRDAHQLAAAGLDASGRTALGQDGSLAAFPTDQKGVFFSGSFTDHAVLQRDQKSAVYGVVVGASATTKVSVEMTGTTDVGEPLRLASPISATVDPSTIATFGDARWKAELPEQKAGGNSTRVASSPGTTRVISDVTFGDVWFCSGCARSFVFLSSAGLLAVH